VMAVPALTSALAIASARGRRPPGPPRAPARGLWLLLLLGNLHVFVSGWCPPLRVLTCAPNFRRTFVRREHRGCADAWSV